MRRLLFLSFFIISTIAGFTDDLHSHANAASVSNESNSTSGWSGQANIQSTNEAPKAGQYCLKITSHQTQHAQYVFNATPGAQYSITIWAKRGQSSNAEFDEWEGFAGFDKRNITGQGWKEYVFVLTAATDHPVIKVFASKNGQNDRQVFIDAVTIFLNSSGSNGGSGGGTGGSGGSSGGTGGSIDSTVYNFGNANLPTVNWQALNFYSAGSVGIGTAPVNQFRLSVNGKIRTKEVVVESGWSDFVFEPGYQLPSLKEVENHINLYGHLKDIPAAATIEKEGVPVGEMNKLLLQKIEELTLYMIDAHKAITTLKEENAILKSRIDSIER
ncbi:MAG: hypothetical protein ACM3ME_10400 [Chloroflexota bacterium]